MATQERRIIEGMFSIADKDGADVEFRLNDVQANLDAHLTGRDYVPKARQHGVSSYFLARYCAVCLSKRNTRAVVISHDTKSTERMLSKVHYFLENLRGPKAVIKNASKNEITFPKTNSMFYLGTAGSRKFGRGDTITHLHCSEVAFWPNAKSLMTGLLQAVPYNGEVAMESTGNGKGNYYHQGCMRGWEGRSRYRTHFYGWLFSEEYQLQLNEEESSAFLRTLDPDLEEDVLHHKYGLSAGRLAWRRQKLEELEFDLNLFKQEYPITIDECFQSTGRSIFHRVKYEPTDAWKRVDRNLYVLGDHPKQGLSYSIGADVSAGVGQDNSVGQVICLETMEQVAEWSSDRTDPDLFGLKLAGLGERFNWAYMTVENNNHGIVTLRELRDVYPAYLIYTGGNSGAGADTEVTSLTTLGMRTSVRTKPLVIGNLRKMLCSELTIHSPSTKDELDSFVETETGSLEAEEGCKDDRVISLALAAFGVRDAAVFCKEQETIFVPSPEPEPFLLDTMIAELRGRGNHGIPISTGVELE